MVEVVLGYMMYMRLDGGGKRLQVGKIERDSSAGFEDLDGETELSVVTVEQVSLV